MILNIRIESKSFTISNQELPVLKDLSFRIKENDFVSIVGPSGCGKSTILRMIMGLDNHFKGELLFKGHKINSISDRIGIVFQDSRLLPWLSVKDNIRFAIKSPRTNNVSDNKIDELISLVGLNDFEAAWPKQLSGGMAQRVSLARALVNTPDLLLMDEPFGALDDFTRKKLQSEFSNILSKNKTSVLMVTHNIDEALFLSKRILVLSEKPSHVLKEFSVHETMSFDEKIIMQKEIADSLRF